MPARQPTVPDVSGATTIFGREFLGITVGIISLVFLAAFEAMAVTTVMPLISADLDGDSLYAVAFSGPLAVGVVGMVAAGSWADRSGLVTVVLTAVGLFVAGLLIAGLATTMPILIVGRLVHGLGGGALSVALYVLVARIYPQHLHPRVFGAFAAAWLIPALVGPFVAGLVAQFISWRWVFLGVVFLVVAAMVMLRPGLRAVGNSDPDRADAAPSAWPWPRTLWSLAAAAAVLAASVAARLDGALLVFCAVASFAIAGIALRPLLPVGTLTGRAGLPVVMSIRGLISGAFMSTEVYLPYLLTDQYKLTPTLAGLALTVAGITWTTASWLQGKYSEVLTDRRSIRIGSVLVILGIAASILTSFFVLAPAVAIVGWAFAGAGMGTLQPRLSTRTLRLSTASEQGFNSSALLIADSIGAALALAATAVVFSVVGPLGGTATYTASFLLSAAIAVVALLLSGRVRDDAMHPERLAVTDRGPAIH